MIPNGAAYEIFSRVQTEKDALSCPEDMKGLGHPVYGFVGMLQECIDYALIEKLAKEFHLKVVRRTNFLVVLDAFRDV